MGTTVGYFIVLKLEEWSPLSSDTLRKFHQHKQTNSRKWHRFLKELSREIMSLSQPSVSDSPRFTS